MSRWTILLSFSIVLGHTVWRIWGPPRSPDYFIGGAGSAMTGPNRDARHVYFRRALYLTERPRHCWMQALSRGRIRIYVNGTLVGERSPDGTMGALLVNPAPFLQVGSNVIAIAAEQYSPRRPAMVMFDAAYTMADGEHRLAAGAAWRCSETFERDKDWWFMPAFDDQHWSTASLMDGQFRAAVKVPPRAVTEPRIGRWVAPDGLDAPAAYFLRVFDVNARPRHAWLHLSTNSMHRIAVNGTVIDVQEAALGMSEQPAPTSIIYDITPFMRRGSNSIALSLETYAGPARMKCDFEVKDDSGQLYRIPSDEQWLCSTDLQTGWLEDGASQKAPWRACQVQLGYLGILPWENVESFSLPPLPASIALARAGGQFGVMAVILMASWSLCAAVGWASSVRTKTSGCWTQGPGVLALTPSIVMLTIAWLAAMDPRVAWQDVYRAPLVFYAVLFVLACWVLLGVAQFSYGWAVQRRPQPAFSAKTHGMSITPPGPNSSGRYLVPIVMAVTVIIGFLIRLPGIANRPLGADEVNMYRCIQGFYERGFPSFVVHKDLPPQFISTSELVYMGGAIAALFFDDDRYVIRFPSACWGTLTILLIYLMGRDMFHPVVGCTAAVLYALAPIAIAMANFGRYPSQLQFFTALSVYCFWRTLNGRAELNHRYLLFTTLSVIAMFLSWEPSLLIAPAMIAGAMWIRRGRLQSILRDPWVWCAIGAVAVVMLLQLSHRDFKQSQRMNFGTGASDVALKTMWRYAQFDIAHFLKATSWCADMALPIAGLFGCIALMVRHAFRDAAIYLLTTLLMTSGIIALLLPVDADRYSYFLTPLLILSATASAVAAARALRKLVPQRAPAAWKWYGRMVARAVVVVLLVCAIELSAATMEWDGTFASVNPMARATRYLSGPASFLRERLQPGDIVLGTQPYLLDHQLSRESGGTKRLEQDSTLWLQTRLHLQAVLNDVRPVPLNRRDGTELVPNLASLETVFAQPRRLWFVVEKGHFNRLNVDEVDSFLRQHMDIVFEDSEAVVLIRDRRHRTAKLRSRDERTLHGAQTDFLRKDAAIIPWVIGDAAGPARSVILNPTEDRDDAGPPSLRFR